MQKYILHRKQQYIEAHDKFKENEMKINKECNEEISIAANNVRYQIETSNKIFQDILSIFKNEDKLSNMTQIYIDECLELINKEFSERQILFNNFATNSNKIENIRKSAIQTEIQNLFQSCIDTGLLPPHKIEKSLQPKITTINQLIAKKTKFYAEFVMRLNENDSKLKQQYEDQYKDGKLRWNQLQRDKNKENQTNNNNINIPNVADEKS